MPVSRPQTSQYSGLTRFSAPSTPGRRDVSSATFQGSPATLQGSPVVNRHGLSPAIPRPSAAAAMSPPGGTPLSQRSTASPGAQIAREVAASATPGPSSLGAGAGVRFQRSAPQFSAVNTGTGPHRAYERELGTGGKGLGRALKRHKKFLRDTIEGVTKGDIRRLARRGGVKRISATTYTDIRQALKERLQRILQRTIAVMELSGRKTVSVRDVVFVLNGLGNPIYGFDPIMNH